MQEIVYDHVEEKVVESPYGEIHKEIDDVNDGSVETPLILEPGNYPDAYMEKMYAYVSTRTRSSAAEMLHSFGKFAVVNFKRDFPGYFKNYASAKAFLKTVNHIIYVELRNLYIDTSLPEFNIREEHGKVYLDYNSERKLCDFLSGLIEGTGEIFEEKIDYRHIQCMKHGKEKCILELGFGS